MERQFGREKCSWTRKGTASSKNFAKTLKIKSSLAPTRALFYFFIATVIEASFDCKVMNAM